MSDISAREEMCEIGRRLWQRNLVGATEGNLSQRLGDNRILCTPSGMSKGHLEPESLVIIDLAGSPLTIGIPSTEIKMHLGIYRERPDCNAIVHAHPIVATALALADVPFPNDVLPEATKVLGNVAYVPFAESGTEEVPNAIKPFLKNHKTFVLRNHGAVTLGKTLMDAFNRMETLERLASVVLNARTAGEVRPLAREASERLQPYLNGDL